MGVLEKQLATHEKDFTILSNEILKYRDEEGNPVPLEALALFLRMLSLKDDWNVNIPGLAKISGCGPDKITSAMNCLIKLGYVERLEKRQGKDGKFLPQGYRINETINKNLWNTEPPCDFPYMDEPHVEKPYMDEPHVEKPEHIKYNINKELNNKEIKNKFQLFPEDKSCLSFSGLKIKKEDINMDTCKMESGTDCSSNLINEKEKHEETAKKRRGGKIKNKVQQKEIEKGDSIRTIDTAAFKHTMDELTQEDNAQARVLKQYREAEELDKALNKSTVKTISNTKAMKKHAAKVIKDVEVLNMMEDYLDTYIPKYGVMSKATFDLMWNDLQTQTNGDKNILLESIRNSIKKGYRDIYVTKPNTTYVPNQIPNSMPEVEDNINESMYELATDEDGNPLMF